MINSEEEALRAMEEVAGWAEARPDYSMQGEATGKNYQRGRVVASRANDGTLGMSTYETPEEARQQAEEMEQAYRNYERMRDASVIVMRR